MGMRDMFRRVSFGDTFNCGTDELMEVAFATLESHGMLDEDTCVEQGAEHPHFGIRLLDLLVAAQLDETPKADFMLFISDLWDFNAAEAAGGHP